MKPSQYTECIFCGKVMPIGYEAVNFAGLFYCKKECLQYDVEYNTVSKKITELDCYEEQEECE